MNYYKDNIVIAEMIFKSELDIRILFKSKAADFKAQLLGIVNMICPAFRYF